MHVEILIDSQATLRGQRIVQAMVDTAPVPVTVGSTYVGTADVLMMYGTGHPVRKHWWHKQLQRGARCIGWDLGYWRHKDEGTCRMRVTMDADHPQRMLRPEPPERWAAEGIALRHDADRKGPVLLVGMGRKSHRAHGLHGQAWELAALRRIQAAHPGRQVLFKPKRPTDPELRGVRTVHGPIAEVLRGTSLVVCRHSNVAVDACIAGVPVVCEDGAAAALYGNNVGAPVAPDTAQRLAFLQSLAWWQWKPEEAPHAWTYLLQRLQEPRRCA